jgi:hypothetical protein
VKVGMGGSLRGSIQSRDSDRPRTPASRASRWCLSQDLESTDRYLETFVVSSWLEHIRQHGRAIVADRELEAKLRDCLANIPSVRHLLYL